MCLAGKRSQKTTGNCNLRFDFPAWLDIDFKGWPFSNEARSITVEDFVF
jgi:hypothetical protein